MNKILFIFFLIISSISFGQNLSEKVGEIEIQLIGQNYKLNSDNCKIVFRFEWNPNEKSNFWKTSQYGFTID